MAKLPETEPRDCSGSVLGGGCQSYWPGHHMHCIHAKRIGQSPWGWRDGTVCAIEGLWVAIQYVTTEGSVRAWHHESLAEELIVGVPLRVHEGYHALSGPFGWINVLVAAGVGPIPEPADPRLWAAERSWGITNLRTGRALPMDHTATSGTDSEQDVIGRLMPPPGRS